MRFPPPPEVSRSDGYQCRAVHPNAGVVGPETSTIGSLRRQAGSEDRPYMLWALKLPASFIARPISIGHHPSEGFGKPDSDRGVRIFLR